MFLPGIFWPENAQPPPLISGQVRGRSGWAVHWQLPPQQTFVRLGRERSGGEAKSGSNEEKHWNHWFPKPWSLFTATKAAPWTGPLYCDRRLPGETRGWSGDDWYQRIVKNCCRKSDKSRLRAIGSFSSFSTAVMRPTAGVYSARHTRKATGSSRWMSWRLETRPWPAAPRRSLILMNPR